MPNKIILLQLALRKEQTQYMTDSGGVWYNDFRNIWSGIASDVSQDFTAEDVENVISVSCAGVDLTQVSSYTNTIDGRATALSTEPSFIYDGVNNILYFRLSNYDDPRSCVVNVGVAIHISDQAYDDTANELLYRPDLIGIPNLSETKDPLFFQKMAFDDFTQEIDNSSRIYDALIDKRIYGQQVKYFLGNKGDAFADFIQVKQGKVQKYTYSDNTLIVRIIDSRTALSRSLPVNQLDQTTYTDLDPDYIGAYKPLVYGFVNRHKCLPLDDGAVQTNYTFMIADTEFHNIDSSGYTIYMDGTDKTSEVINFSASAGTFQLPAAHYDVGKDVTFTGFGFVTGAVDIENPLDVTLDLMENYLEIAYSSTSFNTTEWVAETLKAKNIGISISEPTPTIDIIADLAIKSGTGDGFLLERDGKYTWRSYDPDTEPVLTIYQNMWKTEPSVPNDSAEVLTSATALFNKNLEKNSFGRYTDDSQEDAIYSQFGEYQNKEFETLHYTEANAQLFSESIMERSNDEQTLFTGVIDDKYIDYATVKIGKIAQIEVNRQTENYTYSEWYGKMRCEILSVEPNVNDRECEITFRKIEDIDDFALSRFRITEADEYRITEDGNFRITEVE